MAINYSAHQFDNAFSPSKLGNWEVPRKSPFSRPKIRNGATRAICDENGRFLSNVLRPKSSPWSGYKNTWQLPEKISRYQANELNGSVARRRVKSSGKQQEQQQNQLKSNQLQNPFNNENPQFPQEYENPNSYQNAAMHNPNTDINYQCPVQNYSMPAIDQAQMQGQMKYPVANQMNAQVTSRTQHPAENQTKVYSTIAGEEIRSDLEYIPGDLTSPEQQHSSRSKLLQEKIDRDQGKDEKFDLNSLYLEKHLCTDPIAILEEKEKTRRDTIPHILGDGIEENFEKMTLHARIPDKPTERSPSPLIPALFNFQMAKKMAQENLEHQPLPDCIMDQAFRRLQAQGVLNPGLGLQVLPSASGVGIKTYKAGPTHCTKMKVFRPKTCGVVPKPVVGSHLFRPQTSFPGKEKMGSMDLAICWDYRPLNPLDEPKPARHIDGTNDSAGPAIFTLVKTPRTPEKIETARSGGIFTNTLGDEGFFDKDILRRKTGFAAQRSKSDLKCSCGTSPINIPKQKSNAFRSHSASRQESLTDKRKRCKSSPSLSQIANVSQSSSHKENDSRFNEQVTRKKEHTCSKYGPKTKDQNIVKRTSRLCEKIEPQTHPEVMQKEMYKAAFKAGIPKSNSSGTVTSFDSGCSTMSASTCSSKALHVPKPRHPYAKKNYNIDTLVPPFACLKGGAGQGGYPEHWRLASVYQHAYKPIEQRRRPLLDTVFK